MVAHDTQGLIPISIEIILPLSVTANVSVPQAQYLYVTWNLPTPRTLITTTEYSARQWETLDSGALTLSTRPSPTVSAVQPEDTSCAPFSVDTYPVAAQKQVVSQTERNCYKKWQKYDDKLKEAEIKNMENDRCQEEASG